MQHHAKTILAVLAITFATAAGANAQARIIRPGAETTTPASTSTPTAPQAMKSPAQTQADKAKLDALVTKQLRLSIAKCWKDDNTAPPSVSSVATLVFDLKANGTLAGGPNIVHRRGVATPIALAQTAQRAVRACAPFPGLPAEAFENGWRRIQMTFDTRGL